MCAEKAPNARGVRRVLAKLSKEVLEYDALVERLRSDEGIDAVEAPSLIQTRGTVYEDVLPLDEEDDADEVVATLADPEEDEEEEEEATEDEDQ